MTHTINVKFKMLQRSLFLYLKTLVLIPCLLCEVSSNDESKNDTIFSRSSVEEIDNDNTTSSKNVTDSMQDHLVSLMVKNVKDIFESEEEIATTDTDTSNVSSLLTYTVSSAVDNYNNSSILRYNHVLQIESMSTTDEISEDNATTQSDLFVYVSKNNTKPDNNLEKYGESMPIDTAPLGYSASNRSCVFCDNVAYKNCADPETKFVPSTDCTQAGDMCYSMHTPFGVVERGCYNVDHNLTVYVCSCNLCNHIPIGEMPYMFTSKRDWLANVIELTRVRRLRESVMKNMACLLCEANMTANAILRQPTENTYCFEGKIGHLPTQECQEDEICGIKSIKKEGYIWRGCLKFPLYNYWWTFCDSDLCNHDKLISIYDSM